jgi:hypothetical protein
MPVMSENLVTRDAGESWDEKVNTSGGAWKLGFRATRQAHADVLIMRATPGGRVPPVVSMTSGPLGFEVTGDYGLLAAIRQELGDSGVETTLEEVKRSG